MEEIPMLEKNVLDYESRPNDERQTRTVSNRQARMICAAILCAGGLVAQECQGDRVGGDIAGGILAALAFIVFLIEFIRSYL
jgi:hypothetical protein